MADSRDNAPSLPPREGPWDLPVLPVRGSVLFPNSMAPITIGRQRTLAALGAMDESQLVAVCAQLDPAREDPAPGDLYPVGCAGLVVRVLSTQEDEVTVIAFIEGTRRIRIREIAELEPVLKVTVDVLPDVVPAVDDPEYSALARNITDLFREIVEVSPYMPRDILTVLRGWRDASAIADFVSGSLPSLAFEVKQELLETRDVRLRMRRLVRALLEEREELRVRDKVREEVGRSISQAQREAVLREQLRVIQHELGEGDESRRDMDELERRLAAAGLPEEARREADRELDRLARIPPASPEYSVARTYLDWLAALPWRAREPEPIDLRHARAILDADHYDLEKVKERILEHVAVIALRRSVTGPILCLVGPPGVGKTSVGRSIARAMGRAFARVSLGGMRDEAEIRGHRRTYVGSLPGQIIREMRRVGASDPVFMLDEVDKLGSDFRGDPAAALLEVLDPAQNAAFRDHYLDVTFDLSRVLFIATANLLEPVPPALRDRMEVLELAGYAEEEKLEIARRYLIPQQTDVHGLELDRHIHFADDALRQIIRHHTHEAGVRELERKIAAVCRKQAKRTLESGAGRLAVNGAVVGQLLGAPRYQVEQDLERRTGTPGVAVALAWTPCGGEVLLVEAARVPRDEGGLTITGQVQKVMQESTRAALTWLRGHCDYYGIAAPEFHEYDVHIHVPAGAVPKDGPSAGIVMVAALASLFSERPVRPKTAMTGEITLSGHILPVGGIREKVLAAKRSGISTVVLPARNRADVTAIPAALWRGLRVYFADTIHEALSLALAAKSSPRRARSHHR